MNGVESLCIAFGRTILRSARFRTNVSGGTLTCDTRRNLPSDGWGVTLFPRCRVSPRVRRLHVVSLGPQRPRDNMKAGSVTRGGRTLRYRSIALAQENQTLTSSPIWTYLKISRGGLGGGGG